MFCHSLCLEEWWALTRPVLASLIVEVVNLPWEPECSNLWDIKISAAALTSVLDAFLPAFLSYALRTRFLAYCLFLSITSSIQSLSHVRLFVTPWIEAHQASLSITNYHKGVPKEWQAPNRWSFFPPFCTEGTLHSNRFLKEVTKRSPQRKADDIEISLHEVGLTLISLWAELWTIMGNTNW